MISKLLAERKLPSLLQLSDGGAVTAENWEQRRQELIAVLGENVYGHLPERFAPAQWKEIRKEVTAAGKAMSRDVEISIFTPDGNSFTFPVTVTVPFTAKPDAQKPAFVSISFGKPQYYPMEELVDQDVIVAEMVMNQIALDEEDHYENLIAKQFYPDGKRSCNGPGKIGMWAYAASGVLDFLLSLECVDKERVGVVGHSRLGKTALWAAANDNRFTHAFSNESGCAGAAITRKKVGESFPEIYQRFPYWFCENMRQWSDCVDRIDEAEFDQHYLLAAIAPRKVYVSSAQQDQWADPVSEFLCCCAASEAWELLGNEGFICKDRLPEPGDVFTEGNIGYHLRSGTHFLSRYDWVRFCDFIKK